jgi:hypothetical protein
MSYSRRDLNYGSHTGNIPYSSSNPYSTLLQNLDADPNPNFLRYTLFVLEKSVMGEQSSTLRAIREKMEEKYSLKPMDPWKEPSEE